MGTMTYDSTVRIEVEDAHLAHLEAAIYGKLRRDESFTLSWTRPRSEGGGRSSVWMNPFTSLGFTFDLAEPYPLDRQWIEKITSAAGSVSGLRLTADPTDADSWNAGPSMQWDLI